MNPRTAPIRERRTPPVEVFQLPEHHMAEIAGGVSGAFGLVAVFTDGWLFAVAIVAAFIALAVAALAVAGEVRAHRRAWCRGTPITDGDSVAMSSSADIADSAAGHTPSRLGRILAGVGVR